MANARIVYIFLNTKTFIHAYGLCHSEQREESVYISKNSNVDVYRFFALLRMTETAYKTIIYNSPLGLFPPQNSAVSPMEGTRVLLSCPTRFMR